MSYRLSVFDGLPRTGIPDSFDSYGEYQRLVSQLVTAGLVEGVTKLWWDVRPSALFPTLEMRICDMCTRLDDAITIAALYVCLIRMLYRLRAGNQRWRVYPRTFIHENRWLAQRYGLNGNLVDFGKGEPVSYAVLLYEIIELVREDAEHLGCVAEVEHAREIVGRETGAQRQLVVYQKTLDAGAAVPEALRCVVDWLIEETVMCLGEPDLDRPN